MASEIWNLTASRGGVDAKKLAPSSSSLVRCFHIFHHQPAARVWRSFITSVCVHPSCLHHFVRNTPNSWDTTIHLHLPVSDYLFQQCFPDQICIQETSLTTSMWDSSCCISSASLSADVSLSNHVHVCVGLFSNTVFQSFRRGLWLPIQQFSSNFRCLH